MISDHREDLGGRAPAARALGRRRLATAPRRSAAARTRSAVRPASSALGPIRVAPSSATAPRRSSSSRNATTVMLSRPPRLVGRLDQGRARPRRGLRALARMAAIPSSLTIVVSPSEQSRKTSPGRALKVSVSTSTSASGPERAGDDRALRVVLGLLVGDPALAAQLLDQRVVGGQHPQLAVAPQVGAAVADVGERDLVALDDRRGQRRAHPRAARVAAGRGCGCARWRPRRSRAGSASGDSPVALGGLERLGGDPRGDLAGLRAAHPVGDREQRRAGVVGVLVRRPLAPGVGPERLLCDPQRHQPPSGKLELEAELGVADLDLVEVGELGLALQPAAVEVGAVGRVQVLDVVGGAARVERGSGSRRRSGRRSGRRPRRSARSRARRRGRSARSRVSPPPVTATSDASVAAARPPGPIG